VCLSPHIGTGTLAVADWWLEDAINAVLDVAAAAPAPATTTDRTKMRMASFIMGNLL
jgi:hypothetical protein